MDNRRRPSPEGGGHFRRFVMGAMTALVLSLVVAACGFPLHRRGRA